MKHADIDVEFTYKKFTFIFWKNKLVTTFEVFFP